MPQDTLDLADIFEVVTQAMRSNQQTLNQADNYNQNHGDNMVQTFQTIASALQQKKNSSQSAALSYAAKKLAQSTTSTSGQLYAQNLAQAASQIKGKKIDAEGAISLLQTLIGGQTGGSASGGATGGDLLVQLMGGLTGDSQTTAPQYNGPASGGGLLGTLLGGLTGSSVSDGTSSGGSGDTSAPYAPQSGQPNYGDLLGSLLGGGSASGGGLLGSLLPILVQTLMGSSGMGDSSHRTQSTQVLINAFLQALSSAKS